MRDRCRLTIKEKGFDFSQLFPPPFHPLHPYIYTHALSEDSPNEHREFEIDTRRSLCFFLLAMVHNGESNESEQ